MSDGELKEYQPEPDVRERELNYPGHTSTQTGDLMGPGLDGRFWEVVGAMYDPTSDKDHRHGQRDLGQRVLHQEGRAPMTHCPHPQKHKHRSRMAAVKARASFEGSKGVDMGLEPYYCAPCDAWHLGHQRKAGQR